MIDFLLHERYYLSLLVVTDFFRGYVIKLLLSSKLFFATELPLVK